MAAGMHGVVARQASMNFHDLATEFTLRIPDRAAGHCKTVERELAVMALHFGMACCFHHAAIAMLFMHSSLLLLTITDFKKETKAPLNYRGTDYLARHRRHARARPACREQGRDGIWSKLVKWRCESHRFICVLSGRSVTTH